MKIIKTAFAALIAALICLQPLSAFAATEFSDGVYTFAKTEQNNAIVTDCSLTDEIIIMPDSVLGYPVVGIGNYTFFSNSFVKDITLPSAVLSIGEYAFAKNNGLEYVTVPRWCETISDSAFWNSPNVTIRCWYCTAAYNYALEKDIPYMLLDKILLGDANGDGNVNINDVTTIQRHIAEFQLLDGLNLFAADVNGDNKVSIEDATAIQMYFAEYDTAFPIGQKTDIKR